MRILHLCPLWYPIAPDAPGGIETFLAGLVTALEDLSCENTILASGDSRTSGRLVPAIPTNLCSQMEQGTAGEYVYYEQHQLLLALDIAGQFDVIHSHVGWGAFPFSAIPGMRDRVLHGIHNDVILDLAWFVQQHPELWLVTVSEFQAARLREYGATRCRAIPNGVDVSSFTFQAQPTGELLFVGRIDRAKGPDLAIEVARALQRPLTLAGPIIDERYFARAIEPYLNDCIRYVGIVDHQAKDALFGRAACVLMPSRWEEGFGLVAVEAMSCGTPVVGLANGALPEIIEPGVTGYLADNEADLADLTRRALHLDRERVQERAAARFDMPLVASRYRDLYEAIAGKDLPLAAARL